jgi:hypothetical protein
VSLGVLLAGAVAVSVPNLMLVENEEGTRWCAFDTVSAASARAHADSSEAVVNIWASGGSILNLKIEWAPGSADWAATDTYEVTGMDVVSVHRSVSYAQYPDGVTQTFRRKGKRMVPTARPSTDRYFPNKAPYADLRQAPFHGLLARAIGAGDLPDTGLCAEASRQRRR